MNPIFGSTYAGAYDLLYRDKDYSAECDLIEEIFRAYCGDSISSVLDLGCGTGNHAVTLAARGYEVVGVERSESMLAQAREKLTKAQGNLNLSFHNADIRHVGLNRQFDAALMMFAVLGYQLKNQDVVAALTSARRHLRAGALLIFDVWYGPAVLYQRPSERARVIPIANGKILRFASSELDIMRHLCSVRFNLWKISGDRLLSETDETHRMRYFFPMELELFLESAAFTLVRLGVFPEVNQEPDETTWNVLAVARAV